MLSGVAEDLDILVADNQRVMELKDLVKITIERIGPEAAQELADKILSEENV